MIVTCPACGTRFLIDPRALGAAGRSVRCTQCNHVWMQLPAEDAPRRVDVPPPGAERPMLPARPAMPPPQAARNVPLPPPPPIPTPEIAPPPPQAAPAPPPSYAAAAAETDVVRGSSRPLVIAGVLVLIIAALWYGRDYLVSNVPALQSIYAVFGVAGAGNPNDDLEIRRVTSNRREENGRATLTIEGEVANISSGSRHVPPVRITLEDSGRHAIRSWTVVATNDPLLPGETVPFHASVTDPGTSAIGASVSFDGNTD